MHHPTSEEAIADTRDANGDTAPPPSTVKGNSWVDIPAPEIGEWTPQRLVSVVIPHYEAQAELDLTLAALACQSYPDELIEIVVVDDGSDVPPVITDAAAHMDAKVHVQEDLGFGLARARNLGASVAAGDVLIFLDCDMIPERQYIEAHARWHHAVSDAVVFGFRWHANFESITTGEISDAVSDDAIRLLVDDQEPERPEWIDRYMAETHMLTSDDDDMFRVMSGGNLSIRRATYIDIGGTDETFTQWGGEDNEFGFRVIQHGTVVVPETQAVCWHQGEGHVPSPQEMQSQRLQRPKLDNMVAELGFRRPQPGCSYAVPYAVCSVDATLSSASITAGTVESILGSQFHDLVVALKLPQDEAEATWLDRRFGSDNRVVIASYSPELPSCRFSPLRIVVPTGVLFHETSLDRIVEVVRGPGIGLLHLTVPGLDPTETMVRARLTRAYNRAERHAESVDEIDVWIGRLFGERWENGRGFGFGAVYDHEETLLPVDPDGRGATPSQYAAMKKKLRQSKERIEKLKARRSVLVANSLGELKRSRSWSDLKSSALGFGRSDGDRE